jgi:hypothetical protein
VLGRGGRGASQHRAGGGLSIDRVGLATLAAEPPVRPVDLNDLDAVVEQVPGQAGAVAAGAFHPDQVKAPVASQPAVQLLVAAAISSELAIAQQPALLVDDGSVVGAAVGVHAADENSGGFGQAGVAFPLEDTGRTARTGRAGGHTSDKA